MRQGRVALEVWIELLERLANQEADALDVLELEEVTGLALAEELIR